MQWYYAEQGQQKGPIEESSLVDLVNSGVIRDDTLVWHEGLANWQTYGTARGMRLAESPAQAASDSMPSGSGDGGRAPIAQGVAAAYIPHDYAAAKPSVHYAGFWIRFLARLIDGIILNIALLVVRIPLGISIFNSSTTRDPGAAIAAVVATVIATLVSIVVSAGYEIYFVSAKGATLGKMALGLKIIRPEGEPISMGLAAGRYFAQWISAIIFMIGYIMAGFDDQKRALHDRICETRVIYIR